MILHAMQKYMLKSEHYAEPVVTEICPNMLCSATARQRAYTFPPPLFGVTIVARATISSSVAHCAAAVAAVADADGGFPSDHRIYACLIYV